MQNNFTTPEWVQGSNVYEVNVRQYTSLGTFAAFELALPRLRAMGIQVLWFMPITPISKLKRLGSLGSYYAASTYTDINPEFGTLTDFKQLVEKAHALGFKVIIDWVANHTGWDHEWTEIHPEFYKKDENGNFFDAYGWQDVIDLDYTNEKMRNAMLEAMAFWVGECEIDGFRCDMAHLVPLDFWQAARQRMEEIKPGLFWLAETEESTYHQVFDATYAWQLLHSMEAVAKQKATVQQLADVLQGYATNFPPGAIRLAFTSNHDENSHSGSEYERLGDAAKAFAVLTATWKNCMPLVYSGQELPNKKRLRFFDKDQLDWTGNCWLAEFYTTLLAFHKNCTALNVGVESSCDRINTNADDKVFAFKRQSQTEQVLIILNLSPTHIAKLSFADTGLDGRFNSVFSGVEYDVKTAAPFELKAWDYLVLHRNI